LSLHIELKAPDAIESLRAADKPPYRLLEWRDVQLLAQHESVRMTRKENRLTLQFEAAATADPHAQAETAQA